MQKFFKHPITHCLFSLSLFLFRMNKSSRWKLVLSSSSRKMVHFAVKGTPLKPQTAPKTGHHQLAKDTLLQIPFRIIVWDWKLQVKLCQKHLFLQQLTQNMSKACSLNYKFSTWKLQALNMLCTQIVFCFCIDIQNNLCAQHVLSL